MSNKVHTTNYRNTFIGVSDDCPVKKAEIPPRKESKTTAANIQFDMISHNPYKYTSDDVLFAVYAQKNDISKKDFKKERDKFFSKGQPCFRSSPLPKRYGWGVHSDANGRIAIYAVESAEYKKFSNDKNIQTHKAMRSKR